ncbi:MAG TPA: DUF4157 domain-containing protein, partial [Longimicrobium sp.]|nr:DUF4157 domain-containing protein [Longimicrobium sp.]
AARHGGPRGPRAGGGTPLDGGTRAFMEPRFGHDFGRVRVHTGEAAAAGAEALGAAAYTAGTDVVFAGGRYAPGSAAGRRLLAHELAHVVQQASAPGTERRVSSPGDAGEQAAERAADAVAAGRSAGDVRTATAVPAVQRQPAAPSATGQFGPSPMFLMSMGSLTISGFPVDKATLTDADVARLKGHATIVKTLLAMDPGGRLEVTGHTDGTGTAEHNSALGLERAAAVHRELVLGGVPAHAMGIASAAATQPVVPTKGPEARNRRAEVRYVPARPLVGPGLPGAGLGLPGAGPGLGLPRLGFPGDAPPKQPGVMPAQPGSPWLAPVPRGEGWQPYKLPPLGLGLGNYCLLNPGLCAGEPPGPRRPPPPEIFRPIPAPPKQPDKLRQFFDDQPLLRVLPKSLRDKAVDALVKVDEKAVEGIVGKLEEMDSDTAGMLKNTLIAMLKYMKGEKWVPPTPRPERLPPPPDYSFPRMPGEQIYTIPVYEF